MDVKCVTKTQLVLRVGTQIMFQLYLRKILEDLLKVEKM